MTKEATKRRIDSLRAKLRAAALTATVVLGMNAKAQPNMNKQDPKQDDTEMIAPAPQNGLEVVPEERPSIRAAAAASAMGFNTLEAFDLSNVTWDVEMANGISGCETSNKIASCISAGLGHNKDNHHCLAGVKAILRKAGVNIDNCGRSAYMAAAKLREMTDVFTEIKCDYSVLPYLPEGTVVVQGHGKNGEAKDGHIFVISEEAGKKVQRCGQRDQWQLPKNNNRRTKRRMEHYGNMSVFVPTDCLIDQETFAKLYDMGCVNPYINSMLTQKIAKLEEVDNGLTTNAQNTLQITPQMIEQKTQRQQ